jgi:hypothetical protein
LPVPHCHGSEKVVNGEWSEASKLCNLFISW